MTEAAGRTAVAERPPEGVPPTGTGGGSVRRAALLSGVLVAGGTGLGFLRDLTMAHLFGAGRETDAFLVGWTIPETVSPLLIEDAMALVMVPLITRTLTGRDGVRPLLAWVLPRLAAGLACAVAVIMATAPWLVGLLAPGLPDADAATRCVRLTALTVLTFGVAGFMCATLRAHHRFGPPAAIYLAYNAGILASLALFAGTLHVTAAALGVAIGGACMIAVQAPAFASCVRSAPRAPRAPRTPRAGRPAVELALIAPIVACTLLRQAQVFVERFLGSGLASGSISHLNYAQKVAQVPMVLSLLVVTVTFPRLVRSSASGDTGLVRRRVEADLVVVSGVVLVATAFLVAFAPQIVAVLFEHGRFTPADTERTALILRVYTLGLWGQSVIGVSVRAFFAGDRPTWRPARALVTGLAVTVAVGAGGVGLAGTTALAAANATGITVAALLLLRAVRARVAPISFRTVGAGAGRLLLAALAACAAGLLLAERLDGLVPPVAVLAVGGAVVAAVFAAVALAFTRTFAHHQPGEHRS